MTVPKLLPPLPGRSAEALSGLPPLPKTSSAPSGTGFSLVCPFSFTSIELTDICSSPASVALITESSEGRKIYQFKVVPTRGQPKYTVLSISPEVEPPTQVIPPALPGQRLPIVQAPSQPTDTTNQSQWQAPPATVSQPNNPPSVVSLPPANSTNSPATRQQVAVTPNQNTVGSMPVVTATPKTTPVSKVTSSVTTERPSPNAMALPAARSGIAPYKQPPKDGSSTPAWQERKVTNPRPTATKPANNSSTPGGTNANNVKMPKRTTPPPVIANNSSNSLEEANALVRGLVVARQKGQINHGTTTWKEVQSVVRLLRRGDTKQQATREVGISLQLIDQLITWGQRSTVASN